MSESKNEEISTVEAEAGGGVSKSTKPGNTDIAKLLNAAWGGTAGDFSYYNDPQTQAIFSTLNWQEYASAKFGYGLTQYGLYTTAAAVTAAAILLWPLALPLVLSIATAWIQYTVAALILVPIAVMASFFLIKTSAEINKLFQRIMDPKKPISDYDLGLLLSTAVIGLSVAGLMIAFPSMLAIPALLGAYTNPVAISLVSAVSLTAGAGAFFGRNKTTEGDSNPTVNTPIPTL